MPKSAKKRKDKAADFSKSKLKLGKGKKPANNAIDTSFKARSIVLPTQSIAVEKDGNVPTTKRKLTFDDLLVHIKHYSAATRKEAIGGLRELLEAHWELLESSLTPLIGACVRIIGDEDAGVRKALLSFFTWLLPRIPQEDLAPHASLLFLFITSAQTHIFPEIRIDAVRFLDILLDHVPHLAIDGWNEEKSGHGGRILEGYLGILSAGTKFGEVDGPVQMTSTASVVLTPASKLIVLHSLSNFLQHSTSSLSGTPSTSSNEPSSSLNTWYLASSFGNPEEYHSFNQVLHPPERSTQHYKSWQEQVDPDGSDDDFPPFSPHLSSSGDRVLYDLAKVVEFSDVDTSGKSDFTLIAHLARTLHSTLVATFLDYAPSVFLPNTTPSETEVQLIMSMAQITRSLYSPILQNPAEEPPSFVVENLKTILGYMIPYFPFKLSEGRDIKVEQAFQDLSLIFCELTSLLLIVTHETPCIPHEKPRQRNQRSRVVNTKDALSTQTSRVSEYVVQLLHGESFASSQLGKPLTPAGYTALLPTIWALINHAAGDHQSQSSAVLQAIAEHAIKTPSKSVLKRLTIDFLGQLVLLDTEPRYQGHFRLGRVPGDDRKLEEWITHLPQPLWELGSSNLPTTEIILRFLLRFLQRKSRLLHAKTVASLRSKLIPYFMISHAVRGSLPGPFIKLPNASPLRRLALDLVITINRGLSDDHTLTAAVEFAVEKTEEQGYWIQAQKHLGSNSGV